MWLIFNRFHLEASLFKSIKYILLKISRLTETTRVQNFIYLFKSNEVVDKMKKKIHWSIMIF